MHLLDSSAIVRILEAYRGDAPTLLIEEATLDLAKYELGNTLWKEHTLLKRSTPQEMSSRANEIEQILALMNVICLNTEKIAETLELAVRCQLTFYDAAYLNAAMSGSLTLVTEDEKLTEAASKIGLRAASVRTFASTRGV